MPDTHLFEQQREKVINALEQAKTVTMSEEDDRTIRPLLNKVHLTERVKPEEAVGPIPGANQVPLVLSILAETGSYAADLAGNWINETSHDAMIMWLIDWVRQGIRDGKLPGGFGIIAATKNDPGQDEYGRIIPPTQRRR